VPPGNDSPEAAFARDMIIHHAQAVQMAEIIRDKTNSDSMRLLASDISLTQQAQIGIMQGWLGVWGLPITGDEPAMAWMGHPTHGLMPGMATPEEIDRLSELPSDGADVLFLKLMIAHHQAAVPMAEAVLKRTEEPEVRDLAKAIIESQRAEIENMKAMVDEKVDDSAQVPLKPANGSQTKGTAMLSKAEDGGLKVVLEVSGLPGSRTMYLAHIHPGTCTEQEQGAVEEGEEEHVHSHHEHGASEEIEHPLSPLHADDKGHGTSTTVVHDVTLEGLLSGEPMHVNVHKPGSGEPPPVTCTNLDEASTTTPEPSAKTHASGGASGNTSGEEQAARSQADCRLALYVANKNMSPKEAEAFSELLADMIRTMEGPSWTEGDLRNAALDHLAVPRYRECKHREV
jgi:uncharacterized protein (DUF305 family)